MSTETLRIRILPGLPPYGPSATPIPEGWGLGREGFVVEFQTDAVRWVANFRIGFGKVSFADVHPNQRDAVVVAAGDLWVVEPKTRRAECLLPAIDSVIEVQDPPGWVFDRQGLAFARLGPDGLLWHTRRLSLDGFNRVRIDGDYLIGLAWRGDGEWAPFSVDLHSGRSHGGAFGSDDLEGWEVLN